MKQTLHIKNMVCDRCKSSVLRELNVAEIKVLSIELGQVKIDDENKNKILELEVNLKKHGFEVIKDDIEILVEKIKIALIQKIDNQDDSNLSEFLTESFNKSTSALSRIFSKHEGMTIEKYEINLKIEKVKELIQLHQLNFSEIAYTLNYKNSSHLARQFKAFTGMSMSEYKKTQKWNRKDLDQIV